MSARRYLASLPLAPLHVWSAAVLEESSPDKRFHGAAEHKIILDYTDEILADSEAPDLADRVAATLRFYLRRLQPDAPVACGQVPAADALADFVIALDALREADVFTAIRLDDIIERKVYAYAHAAAEGGRDEEIAVCDRRDATNPGWRFASL